MPEPREPIVPPEPACACHGWPGSVCDARRAADRFVLLWFALGLAIILTIGGVFCWLHHERSVEREAVRRG